MGAFLKLLSIAVMCVGALQGSEVLVNTLDGEVFLFEVEPSESIATLKEKLCALKGSEQEQFLVEIADETTEGIWNVQQSIHQGGDLGFPRDYSRPVTAAEKSDIRYIVTTLANKSLISIAVVKSSLDAAGDRIDHIHPLRFLMTIFSDEELKVGIRNIRGRGWIWNQFSGGLKNSLSTEWRRGNLREEDVEHFSGVLEVDAGRILAIIETANWDQLLDYLVTHIPRKGDHDRYDM